MNDSEVFSVSQFVETLNQIVEYGLPFVRIEGEVTGYKISKNKWVSFRLRDDNNKVSCFMGAWQLNVPIEDGMKVVVAGNPRFKGKYGLFSINVQRVVPAGDGALDRAYQLLKSKLEKQGLFADERKRSLPDFPEVIGVISSDGAAGWGDFRQRVRERWPIIHLKFKNVLVQGERAAPEIITALKELNTDHEVELIVIVRGGGAKEDLFAFNDEALVKEISGSKHPVVVGVGHERDETLAQLAADVGALTPTHAAELVAPSAEVISSELGDLKRYVGSVHKQLIQSARAEINSVNLTITTLLKSMNDQLAQLRRDLKQQTSVQIESLRSDLKLIHSQLQSNSPKRQLERGYAIVRAEGRHIAHAQQLKANQHVSIMFDDDERQATVQ